MRLAAGCQLVIVAYPSQSEGDPMHVGRCRDCETLYDYLELERCPKCGNFTGSAYGGVEVLEGPGSPPRVTPAAGALVRPAPRTNGRLALATASEGTRLEVLRAEYALVEQAISALDRSALALKACSVTVAAVLAAYALASGRHEVLLVAAFASAMLWVVEAIGKSFQGVYLGRAHDIEIGIADSAATTDVPGIAAAWRRHWRPTSFGRYLAIARWHIALPHLLMAGAAAGLYLALELPRFH
jgi:hypothetical protein